MGIDSEQGHTWHRFGAGLARSADKSLNARAHLGLRVLGDMLHLTMAFPGLENAWRPRRAMLPAKPVYNITYTLSHRLATTAI